jgi:hypothetical protein
MVEAREMAFFAFGHLVCTTMGQKEALQDQYMKHVAGLCDLGFEAFRIHGNGNWPKIWPKPPASPAAAASCTYVLHMSHSESLGAHTPVLALKKHFNQPIFSG